MPIVFGDVFLFSVVFFPYLFYELYIILQFNDKKRRNRYRVEEGGQDPGAEIVVSGNFVFSLIIFKKNQQKQLNEIE